MPPKKPTTNLALAEMPNNSAPAQRKLKTSDIVRAGYIPFPISVRDENGQEVSDTLYFKQPKLSHKMTLANSKIKGGEVDFEYLISLLPEYVVTDDGKAFFTSADEVESVGDLQLGARLVKKLLNLMMGQDEDEEESREEEKKKDLTPNPNEGPALQTVQT